MEAIRRRRVFVPGSSDRLGRIVREWTVRLGHDLVEAAQADVTVALDPETPEAASGGPWLVVTERRLSPEQRAGLRRAGATEVLDGRNGLLDLTFAYAETLFGSRSEQRRHGLAYGRLEAHVVPAGVEPSASTRGRLVGLNRCGTWVEVPAGAFTFGDLVDLVLPFEDLRFRMRGRVVGQPPSAAFAGRTRHLLVALELVLEHCEGFPGFRGLARARPRSLTSA
ncbi:MAG: hypothetical protein AAFZ18_36835 [Myxococcota bacterium]